MFDHVSTDNDKDSSDSDSSAPDYDLRECDNSRTGTAHNIDNTPSPISDSEQNSI